MAAPPVLTKEEKERLEEKFTMWAGLAALALILVICFVFLFPDQEEQVAQDVPYRITVEGKMVVIELDPTIVHLHLVSASDVIVTGEKLLDPMGSLDFGGTLIGPVEETDYEQKD